MARHTNFKIGGSVDLFYEAKTTDELVKAAKLARKLDIPYFILGDGSNLLVADKGFRGLVVKVQSSKFKAQNEKISADAGIALVQLVEKVAKLGLSGLEFAAGIPGTLGGAVVGNAGAWQQSIGERVLRIKALTKDGQVKWINCKDCQFAYRQSRFKKSEEAVLRVELGLEKGDKKEIEEKIAVNLRKRKRQPKDPSAGCIFVNPKSQAAGKMIEACGLKGKKIGDAQISPQHANFIVNLEKAKASEVIQLIKLAKREVKKKFGVELKEEICLLGFDKI